MTENEAAQALAKAIGEFCKARSETLKQAGENGEVPETVYQIVTVVAFKGDYDTISWTNSTIEPLEPKAPTFTVA